MFHITGAANDGLTLMESLFENHMRKFFTQNKFERGGMAGGLFNWKMLRKMLEPSMLQRMSLSVGPEGNSFIAYLHSIRELYSSLVRKEFKLEYAWTKVQEYKKCFNAVHDFKNAPYLATRRNACAWKIRHVHVKIQTLRSGDRLGPKLKQV